MVDPVEEVSDIALERGLPLHVDSCIGGFMLPWSAYMHCSNRGLQLKIILFYCRVEKLGYPVPVFDFRLAGVTSMSADVHKYGLGAKVSLVTSLLFLLSCQLPPPLPPYKSFTAHVPLLAGLQCGGLQECRHPQTPDFCLL